MKITYQKQVFDLTKVIKNVYIVSAMENPIQVKPYSAMALDAGSSDKTLGKITQGLVLNKLVDVPQ